jgi:hypothetical protein
MATEISDVVAQKQYLNGLKLFTLLGSLTLVTFLVLLDTSIIGTVRITEYTMTEEHLLNSSGYTAYYHSVPLAPRCGVVCRGLYTRIVRLQHQPRRYSELMNA